MAHIANAYNFPDALSGAPVEGLDAAPALLVPTAGIPAVIQHELMRLQPGRIDVLGGARSLSNASAKQLSTYFGQQHALAKNSATLARRHARSRGDYFAGAQPGASTVTVVGFSIGVVRSAGAA